MTTQQRDVFWQQQIASWLSSRLSAPAFCKLHDLSCHQFSYWRRKLATPQLDKADSSAGFARVTLPPSQTTHPGLTLTLPNGIAISGLHASNIELLGAIMRLL